MSLEVGRSPFVLKKIINIFLILAFATICWGCGTSEEKKAKHLSNAHKYEKSQEYKKAAKEFKNVIQIDPKQVKVRLALGRLFFMDGKYKKADAYHYRGLALLGKKEGVLAQKDLIRAVELNPILIGARLILAGS